MKQACWCRIMAILLFPLNLVAQTTTPYLPPSYPTGMPVNYVRTWDALKPESNASNITTAAAAKDFRMTTQYMDGLGRPIQTVIKQGSYPSGYPLKDMISTVIYDEFGREAYKFLPSPATGMGGNGSIDDGLFKKNPFEQQANALSNDFVLSPIIDQGETYFYELTKFEASPLNRVTETFAPGNSWVGTASQSTEAGRRSVKIKYYTNTANDSVRIWTVNSGAVGSWATFSSAAAYAAGELYKTITTNEQGKQVIEFKDKQGQVVLKKVQISGAGDGGAGVGHSNDWLCTYYMYDVLGRLRCVLQPQGVRNIRSNWVLVNTLIEQGFRYEYDEKNRLIMKRVPGNGSGTETVMVYDARDRLVMLQDANMRLSNRWLVTKYDPLNRSVETGLWITPYTFPTHRVSASTSTNYPNTTSNYERLTLTHYDDYTGLPGGLTSTLDNTGSSQFYTSYNTSPTYAQQLTVSAQTLGLVTWTQTKVLGTTSDFIYSVNLYDGKGRLIQTKSKNNTGGEDISTTQYNWSGQPIITVSKTEKAGTNAQTITVVNRFTYDGLARFYKLEKKIAHSAINSGALSANWTTIFHQYHDAIGQVNKKTIGNKKDPSTGMYYTTRQPLQELVYDHNIRGWMLGVNRDYLSEEDQTDDGKLFGFELGYDKLTSKAGNDFAAAQYTGNINGLTWKSDGDDKRRRYDFSYDGDNRLLKAEFKQNNTGTTWDKNLVDFTVQMGNSGGDDGSAYDANGNIQKMKQWGQKLTGPAQIDNLSYTYWNSGNMLKAVTESGTGTTDHQLGDFTDKNTTATDYGYDRNGNLVIDLNKRINGTVSPATGLSSGGGIVYNHLNLPAQITVRNEVNTADKGTITYVYDAGGAKLKKITAENGVSVTYSGSAVTTNITTTTTYLNGLVLESRQYSDATLNTALGYTDKLQFFGQEEGRIRAVYNPASLNTLTALEYDYMIKDHLGNVRMVLAEELKTDAYPEATMETAQATTENTFYSNLDATRVDKPSGYPTNSFSEPDPQNNHKVALVRGDGNKIGPAILLKVMAGDKFNLRTRSWYLNSPNPQTHKPYPVTPGTPVSPITDLIALLNGGIPGISGGKITSADITQSGGISTGDIQQFLSTQNDYAADRPKAFVNWVLFDEQLKFVENGSGFEQVPEEGEYWNWTLEAHTFEHIRTELPVTKNGYLYIYVNNETPNIDVFFDNLQVTHVHGPILEETHYYPFGLTMAGISSKALAFGGPENKSKFNNKELQNEEFSDGWGLEMYDFSARMYDVQLARWGQPDPLAENSIDYSPYQFVDNNPIRFNDPSGMSPEDAVDWNFELVNALNPDRRDARRVFRMQERMASDEESEGDDGRVKVDKPLTEYSGLKKLYYKIFGRSIRLDESTSIGNKELGSVVVEYSIDSDGYIDLDEGRLRPMEARLGVGSLRFLSKLRNVKGNLASFVRNETVFKNVRLRDFLAKYYREGAKIGNGSSHAALMEEAITGVLYSAKSHFQKVKDAQTFFTRMLNNSSAILSETEKQFVLRQLGEIRRAIKLAEARGLGPNGFK